MDRVRQRAGAGRRAFTLVEVLVAAAVAALAAAAFYQTMAASAIRFRQGESGLEASEEAQRILEYLRKDMQGPFPWTPCNYPEKVLKSLGFPGSRLDFAVIPRRVARWITYYRTPDRVPEGPVREATRHLAEVGWNPTAGAPCEVSWPCCTDAGPRWIGPSPPMKELECLRTDQPWVDFLERSPRTGGRDFWVIGPAIWRFDPATGSVVRWTEESGAASFGEGRLERFGVMPTEEHSANEYLKPKRSVGVGPSKHMLEVSLAFRRDAGRIDLELRTLLTVPPYAAWYGPIP